MSVSYICIEVFANNGKEGLVFLNPPPSVTSASVHTLGERLDHTGGDRGKRGDRLYCEYDAPPPLPPPLLLAPFAQFDNKRDRVAGGPGQSAGYTSSRPG